VNPFRTLDDALVPLLARGLRRSIDLIPGVARHGGEAHGTLPRPAIEARVIDLQPVEPAAVEPAPVTPAPVTPDPLERVVPAARVPRTAPAAGRRPRRRRGLGVLRRAARLDARVSHRGVLGFVRDLPQAGFVVIGALIIVAALAIVHIDAETHSVSDATSPGAPVAIAKGCPAGELPPGEGAADVGPDGSESVPAYIAMTASTFSACLAADPAASFYAVVSFDRLKTPADAAAALNGATVLDAFVDLAGATDSPRVLPLTGADDGVVRVTASITAGYAAAAGQFEQDGMLQSAQANSIVATNAVERAGKASFEQAAQADAYQAHQLDVSCACTYGAVVVGRLSELATLRTSDVRAIDLAPAGTVASGLTARPLLPTETTTLSAAAEPTTVVAGNL
jgi:hypothetical protein